MAPGSVELPEGIERDRHVGLGERQRELWGRRALTGLLTLVAVAALLNLFGQRETRSTVVGTGATLSVKAPERLRGGLLYQTRFDITARRPVERLHLVLSPGWLDGLTLNTIEPSPGQEGSRNGRLSLSYGTLDPGQKLIVFAEWQVNPTTIAHRGLDADVYDGGELLAHVHRTLTVFP